MLLRFSRGPALTLLFALLPACAEAPRRADSFSTPPVLDAAAFDAATAADLEAASSKVEGRSGATLELPPLDTFHSPPRLSAAEFTAATTEDIEAAGNLEEADLPPEPAAAGSPKLTQITLTRDFIEQVKNRATLTTEFQVIGASRVHSIGKGGDDGDIHIGGLANDVGLPCVVEIVNAKDHAEQVDRAKELAKDQGVVDVTGTWRIWCEHPGVPQVQFATPYHGPDSNPDHVLELHPTSRFDGKSLLGSYVGIDGYEAYDAKKAFDYYESVPAEMEIDDNGDVTLWTPQAGYNYAAFQIEIAPLIIPDGRIVRCSVLDDHGNVVTEHRRMVFTKNSAAEKAVRKLGKGDRMRVLGIPRVNLAVIAWRADNAEDRPEVLAWRLPYEMIVVARL